MIQVYLLSVHSVWMMFAIKLMITTQQDKKNLNWVWWYDAEIMAYKRFYIIVNGLFIRCRKLNNAPFVFITQTYFSVPKEVRLNSTPYLITKIIIKRVTTNCY